MAGSDKMGTKDVTRLSGFPGLGLVGEVYPLNKAGKYLGRFVRGGGVLISHNILGLVS